MRVHYPYRTMSEELRGWEPDEVLEIRFAQTDHGAPSHRLVCVNIGGVVRVSLYSIQGEMRGLSDSLSNLVGASATEYILPKKAVRGWQAEVYRWLKSLSHYEIISVR